ncbi:hypothetical protein ACVIHI_001461 [Bradyrhizobium sp. USDA 4524]|uniref:hypothetical protein n=1 Tax=Bradyrhizobium TaxID=374 RepID=UPI00209C9281|nr:MULTISPECIES: hypothetical protein [unclassified Bradyrhizobium]MCP1837165.1 hypothetical protein [Bradyrhizobium sp. USDA 4538]MCP1906183.1 hypothetical protein [Bradyrhizobium sp. USDA 4537]MCP1988162.1 hypothetical protein [Bradyrhizobium sp. USDA 4539]
MHTNKPAGGPFKGSTHAGCRRIDLTEKAILSSPACFGDRDGIFQIRDVDSDKASQQTATARPPMMRIGSDRPIAAV